MKKIIPFVLILFVFCSCGQRAEDVDPNLEGSWKRESAGGGTIYLIEIDDFMGSTYCESKSCYGGICECSVSAEGKARIRNNKLWIGTMSWNIDEYPASTGADPMTYNPQWYMVLDGETYYR